MQRKQRQVQIEARKESLLCYGEYRLISKKGKQTITTAEEESYGWNTPKQMLPRHTHKSSNTSESVETFTASILRYQTIWRATDSKKSMLPQLMKKMRLGSSPRNRHSAPCGGSYYVAMSQNYNHHFLLPTHRPIKKWHNSIGLS